MMEEKETNGTMQNFEEESIKTAEQPQVSPQPRQKVRRVGTFTMGCVMILAGAAILSFTIWGWGNLMLLAKLAPLVLVVLGIEVLVASFYHKAKLKYDVFGVILSSLVVCIVVAAAVGYQWLFVKMPQIEKTERQVQQYISDKLYESVNKEGIRDVNVHLSRSIIQLETQNIQDTMKNSDIFLEVLLQSEYAQPAKLAEKAAEINQVIKQELSDIDLNFVHLTYTSQNQETKDNLFLYIGGKYNFDQNAAELEQQIQTEEHRYDIQNCVNEYEVQLKEYRDEISQLTQQLETQKIEYEMQIEDLNNQNNAG